MNFEVLRDLAAVCSENGRLKMAEKLTSRKLPLKTKYKSCRKDFFAEKSLRTSALFSLWSHIRSAPIFCVRPYPCFSIFRL